MGLSCSRCGVSGCTQGSSGVCVQIQCFGVNVQRPWGQSTASVCDPSARGLEVGGGIVGSDRCSRCPRPPYPRPHSATTGRGPLVSPRGAPRRAAPSGRARSPPPPRGRPLRIWAGAPAPPPPSGRFQPRRAPSVRPSVRPVRSRPAAVAWGPPGRRDRAALPGIAPTAEPRRPRPPSRGTQRGAAPERRSKTPRRPRPGLEPRRAPPRPSLEQSPDPPLRPRPPGAPPDPVPVGARDARSGPRCSGRGESCAGPDPTAGPGGGAPPALWRPNGSRSSPPT